MKLPSDNQIRQLRREAAQAGDDFQILICERALTPDGEWDEDEHAAIADRIKSSERRALRQMSRAMARELCAEAIEGGQG